MFWSKSDVGEILAAVLNVLMGVSSSNFEVLYFHYLITWPVWGSLWEGQQMACLWYRSPLQTRKLMSWNKIYEKVDSVFHIGKIMCFSVILHSEHSATHIHNFRSNNEESNVADALKMSCIMLCWAAWKLMPLALPVPPLPVSKVQNWVKAFSSGGSCISKTHTV